MTLSAEKTLVAGLGALGLIFLVAPMLVIILASLDPGEFFEFPPRTLSHRRGHISHHALDIDRRPAHPLPDARGPR